MTTGETGKAISSGASGYWNGSTWKYSPMLPAAAA